MKLSFKVCIDHVSQSYLPHQVRIVRIRDMGTAMGKVHPHLPEPRFTDVRLVPVRRNIRVDGRRTTLCLERAWWDVMETIQAGLGVSIDDIVTEIDRRRGERSLAGALRVYLLDISTKGL